MHLLPGKRSHGIASTFLSKLAAKALWTSVDGTNYCPAKDGSIVMAVDLSTTETAAHVTTTCGV